MTLPKKVDDDFSKFTRLRLFNAQCIEIYIFKTFSFLFFSFVVKFYFQAHITSKLRLKDALHWCTQQSANVII